MLENLDIYDAIYTLAVGEGCEQVLFGDCSALAREAFLRSSASGGFPMLWFEVPLTGKPRFDLHVALSRESLRTGARYRPCTGNGYDELFHWFAEDEVGGNGLAFAFDVSEGRIDDPAVHVNVNNAPLADMARFFDLAAGNGAYERYANFENRLPQGWKVWYAGFHPGRPGSPVRVDCFVDATCEASYAADVELLEHDLRTCGFTCTGPALYDLATPILKCPFDLELQFDVMHDGALGPTLGISASFPRLAVASMRELFGDGGEVAGLMGAIEGMGLADGRWRHVPDALFATLVEMGDIDLALYCTPTFVKLRMRDGEPLDAKVYLQAGASVLV